MNAFTYPAQTDENYWRSVILFGRNVASYKFALGSSLLELAQKGSAFVTLEELALPFAKHICTHLEQADTQGTSSTSRFLDSCRQFNAGETSDTELLKATVSLGFVNVIDAFHVVGSSEIPTRFFVDERKTTQKGIRLTDELLALPEGFQFGNLGAEVEARWRLVETAWNVRVPTAVLEVSRDPDTDMLVTGLDGERRRSVTGCRDALAGYQKGRCFYCQRDLAIAGSGESAAEVDHFLPHVLARRGVIGLDLDQIWNLVLACWSCNHSKLALAPEIRFLERLETRNSFYIHSYHPLRETLIAQTGDTPEARHVFLQEVYNEAYLALSHTWEPASVEASVW